MRILTELRTHPATSRLAFAGRQLTALLTGDTARLAASVDKPGPGGLLTCVAIIAFGDGLYGFTLGWWRGPLQSRHTAWLAGNLRVWFVVFVLVCLQMTTALRPIIGRSDTFLPTKKLFFLSHWGNNLHGGNE